MNPLENLQREIRNEAEQLAPVTTLPHGHDEALPFDHPQRADYDLDELIHVHHEAFAERAFRSLLKQPPGPAGLLDILDRLQRGDSKIAILGDLRWSIEGRRHGVRVRGLRARYAFWWLTRIPLLGGAIERIVLIAALPVIAREQRRLAQALLREESETAAELATLRAEVERLRAECSPR